MENARLLHFLLLSITILLFSCTKRGGDDVKPKEEPTYQTINEPFLLEGKYVAEGDPTVWFIISPLVVPDDTITGGGMYGKSKQFRRIQSNNLINIIPVNPDLINDPRIISIYEIVRDKEKDICVFLPYTIKPGQGGTLVIKKNIYGDYELGYIYTDSSFELKKRFIKQ